MHLGSKRQVSARRIPKKRQVGLRCRSKARLISALLDAKVADELALGKRPSAMSDDEAAVYEFCIKLHRTRNVDDATFNRALALFGERGVVDLIGVSGYYTAVSMTLNVAHVMPPEGTVPLK
jgi:4-carboxymuconolactone decarboxylase